MSSLGIGRYVGQPRWWRLALWWVLHKDRSPCQNISYRRQAFTFSSKPFYNTKKIVTCKGFLGVSRCCSSDDDRFTEQFRNAFRENGISLVMPYCTRQYALRAELRGSSASSTARRCLQNRNHANRHKWLGKRKYSSEEYYRPEFHHTYVYSYYFLFELERETQRKLREEK